MGALIAGGTHLAKTIYDRNMTPQNAAKAADITDNVIKVMQQGLTKIPTPIHSQTTHSTEMTPDQRLQFVLYKEAEKMVPKLEQTEVQTTPKTLLGDVEES